MVAFASSFCVSYLFDNGDTSDNHNDTWGDAIFQPFL